MLLILIITLGILSVACASGKRNGTSAGKSAADASGAEAANRRLPPLPPRELTARLRRWRDDAASRASQTRGLGWLGEVGMTELSGWEYGTRANEMAHVLGGDEDLNRLGRLAVAGGMLPAGTDLATLAASFTAASAGATYSPLDKQVLIVEDKKQPDKSLLTHEFVHALQDQHFDLLKLLLAKPYSFDRSEAMFAVVEGDAMNVQRRIEFTEDVWARRSLEDVSGQEERRFGEYRRELGALFPPLLTETFIFRYRDGARFVEAVRRKRGQSGVNELFRNPPQSSEQILHPEKYLGERGANGTAPVNISLDEAKFTSEGWRAVTSTPLGEIGIRGLLMRELTAEAAQKAASGWGGDRAYLFERDANSALFVWQTAWDRTEDASEFFRSFSSWSAGREGSQKVSETLEPAHAQNQVLWRDGLQIIFIKQTGDRVLVLRGAEADVQRAAQKLS